MDNKGINSTGLKHLWEKALSTFAKKEDLNNNGGEDKILRVTAIAIPTSETGGNITITNSSFAEIREAYDNGHYIFIDMDLSYLGMNGFVTIPMSVIDFANNFIAFTRAIDLGGEPAYLGGYIFESETLSNFILRPLTSGGSGGSDNSTFIVNAEATVRVEFPTDPNIPVLMINEIKSVDKSVASIMEAAKSERDVRLCVDVTESVKPIVGVTGNDVKAIIYFNLTILTSISDVIFSAIIDFTGLGTPVVTRIQGTLDDTWRCTSIPIIQQS